MRAPSLFRRLVSLLLAVLVLATSVGFTVQRLTCRMSGRSTVAVSLAPRPTLRSCLGTPATTVQDNCCDFSKQLHKLTTPAHELAVTIAVPAPILALVPPALRWPVPAPMAVVPGSAPRWFAADSLPPPLSGRGLLAFVCTLVV